MSTEQQQHFAKTALAAFDERGLTTDEMVRFAGGPSNTTMTVLRKVARGETTMKEPRSDTARRIERAAYWKPGSVRELWRNGTMPELEDPPITAASFGGDGERARYPKLPPMPTSSPRPIRIAGDDPLALAFRRMADLEDRIEVLETFMEEVNRHGAQTQAEASPNSQAPVSGASDDATTPEATRSKGREDRVDDEASGPRRGAARRGR